MSAIAEQLAGMDGIATAGLVRAGEVSAREVVQAALARAERLNPSLKVSPSIEMAAVAAREVGLAVDPDLPPRSPVKQIATMVSIVDPFLKVEHPDLAECFARLAKL